MTHGNQSKKAMLEEVNAGTQEMSDPDVRLLIEAGMITQAEIEAILSAHRERYLSLLKRLR